MKKMVCCWMVTLVCLSWAQSGTEVWYDWQGKPLGALPTESPPKIQASDLIRRDATLIRAEAPPWKIDKWGKTSVHGWDYDCERWFPLRRHGVPYLRCRPTTAPWSHIHYGGSGSWSISIQRPGFSLYWRR